MVSSFFTARIEGYQKLRYCAEGCIPTLAPLHDVEDRIIGRNGLERACRCIRAVSVATFVQAGPSSVATTKDGGRQRDAQPLPLLVGMSLCIAAAEKNRKFFFTRRLMPMNSVSALPSMSWHISLNTAGHNLEVRRSSKKGYRREHLCISLDRDPWGHKLHTN